MKGDRTSFDAPKWAQHRAQGTPYPKVDEVANIGARSTPWEPLSPRRVLVWKPSHVSGTKTRNSQTLRFRTTCWCNDHSLPNITSLKHVTLYSLGFHDHNGKHDMVNQSSLSPGQQGAGGLSVRHK